MGLAEEFMQIFSLFADFVLIFLTNSLYAYLAMEQRCDSSAAAASSFYQRIGKQQSKLFIVLNRIKLEIRSGLSFLFTTLFKFIYRSAQEFLRFKLNYKEQQKSSISMHIKSSQVFKYNPLAQQNHPNQYLMRKSTKESLGENLKKTQEFGFDNTPVQYEKLAKMYQRQNEEIQNRNQALLETVRELKQRQNSLLEEIAELQLYHGKIVNAQKKKPFKQINNKQNLNGNQIISNHRTSVNSQVQAHNQGVGVSLKEFQVRDFNEEFCKLVEQSIVEKDLHKRKMLRKELAKLATEMKRVRSINSETESGQGILKKNIKQCEPSTNKTLAPYIQDSSSKRLQKIKLMSPKNGSKLCQSNILSLKK